VSRIRFKEVLSGHWVALLCLVLVLVLGPVVPGFASAANLRNVFSSLLPLLAVAVGQTLVLITGGIDLSVTAVVALASVLGARVMTADGGLLAGHPLAVPAAVLVMMATGLVVGTVNGLSVARLRMPPFLATLAVMTFAGGFAIWLTRSANIAGLPEGFRLLGAGSLGELAPLPTALLVVGPLVLGAHVLLTRTVLGRWLFASELIQEVRALRKVRARFNVALAVAETLVRGDDSRHLSDLMQRLTTIALVRMMNLVLD